MIGLWGEGGLSAPLLGHMAQFTPRGYFCQNESGIGAAWSGAHPVKDRCDVMGLRAVGQGGAVDHQDRNLQLARGDQFCLCAGAARILGHNQIDAMRLHQPLVRGHIKRATVDDDMVVGQGGWGLRRIDQTQKVAMRRPGRESMQMHPPEGQHDGAPWHVEGGHGSRDVRNMRPQIAIACDPCRAGQRQQRRARKPGCAHRIGADRGGERMGCIDQMGDMMCAQILCQPVRAAKPAHAHRHRLGFRAINAACVAEGRGQARAGQFGDKACGFYRAAEDKDVLHG